MPKSIGKAKTQLVFDSDEEEASSSSKSRRAEILDELLASPSTASNKPKPKPAATVTAPATPPASRPALLPTPPPLPVYHLKLEDFNIEDIVVKVSV